MAKCAIYKYFRAKLLSARHRISRSSFILLTDLRGRRYGRPAKRISTMRIKTSIHLVLIALLWMTISVPAIGLQTSALTQVSGPQAAVSTNNSHDIAGDWQGTLEFPASSRPAAKYRLVLRVAKTSDGGWTALNYSIDQGPEPMHTSGVSLQGSTFKFSIAALHGNYEGTLSADGNSIHGVWTQGAPLPLDFVRATKESAWEIPAPAAPPKPMAADANPSFAVATIKPSNPGTPSSQTKIIRVIGRQYVTQNTSLADLIEVAYGVHPRQIKGPSWVADDKFDLVAVPDGEGQPSGNQWLTMVQKLLADRFQLALHREKKELPVYLLSVGKSGPTNVTASQSTSPFPSGLEFVPSADGLTLPARNTAMAQFAQMLQQVVLDRPVIDKTGLAGRFDFEFTFTPDESQFNGHPPRLPPPTNTTHPSPDLFDAMQRQLGLKLTPDTAPVDVLVIDHAEKPSAN
jgi:uncharacterized protein (TIGR03435 family)